MPERFRQAHQNGMNRVISTGKSSLTVVVKNYVPQVSTEDTSAFSLLSIREREVLQLLAEGKSTKDIASEFFLSVKTIETYRQKIMDRLDIHNLADLIKFAIREGLTSLEN
jgi:DNA-binding NarL/FixJ family response regulator